ncbi:hypothetical protein WICMUC_003515 [Wickerhamomyces mucosus]|uniref:Uncharacterized protein n=1 Tax=Wickerhamomyces mucosus TaxID=1378264 RepID=A0A9P8TCH9_9ASCO|nr:hypothetical protein WICMUC_003515 [Wickerhamomyces mucosus]
MVFKHTTPQRGIAHQYSFKLQAFELERNKSGENAIIFIGGLGDGLLTVPYIINLNEKLNDEWSIFQILTSSSYIGWGTGSLDRDVKEINQLVKYLKETLGKKKIVLLGHSTGTQDSIHYSLSLFKDNIDGIILQAPVSDREAIKQLLGDQVYDEYNKEAQLIFDKYSGDELLPKKFSDKFLGAPINAYRWLSLSLEGGDDDYFSSDLSDEKLDETFGKLSKPLLVLYSGNDEFVPKSIDKQAILNRWEGFVKSDVWSKYSSLIPDASHNVANNPDSSVEFLIERVNKYLFDL